MAPLSSREFNNKLSRSPVVPARLHQDDPGRDAAMRSASFAILRNTRVLALAHIPRGAVGNLRRRRRSAAAQARCCHCKRIFFASGAAAPAFFFFCFFARHDLTNLSRYLPSPGADWRRGEPSPGADGAGVSPVPVQMWAG
jgi:hypothetical protein